jgi:hypothetical protein
MLRGASRALVAEAALVALVAMLALSCASTPRQGAQTPDERLIAKGQDSWNSKGPEAARQYWSALTDAASKKAYLGYIDRHAKLVSDLDAAAAMGVGDPARLAEAFDGAEKSFSSFPTGLKLPSDTKAKAVAAASDRARALIEARKIPQARELAQSALSAFGDSKELAAVAIEAETLLYSQKDEAGADAVLAKARGREDFYAKIDGYQDAIAAYAKVKTDLADRAVAIGASDSKAVAAASGRLEKKRQDARIEMERRLRERQYSFKDRIGEEFARVPEGDRLGSMSLEEILAYQEGIKSSVEKDYQEMKDFGDKFPAVIDKDMLKDVEDQKDALDKRIAQVQAEIRTAKDIASRGKTVMPVMIGLFNPQPGGRQSDQKSRPAAFRGKTSNGPDYWWGMAAIPKGTMNDLVIEVSDGRTVRAFAENTKSGALIGEPGVKDIVNRGYKMGSMWPVLNAGNQLGSGNYFFEVQGGAKPSYEGEVVIYSSFIARMR